jgi:hypothetical protein
LRVFSLLVITSLSCHRIRLGSAWKELADHGQIFSFCLFHYINGTSTVHQDLLQEKQVYVIKEFGEISHIPLVKRHECDVIMWSKNKKSFARNNLAIAIKNYYLIAIGVSHRTFYYENCGRHVFAVLCIINCSAVHAYIFANKRKIVWFNVYFYSQQKTISICKIPHTRQIKSAAKCFFSQLVVKNVMQKSQRRVSPKNKSINCNTIISSKVHNAFAAELINPSENGNNKYAKYEKVLRFSQIRDLLEKSYSAIGTYPFSTYAPDWKNWRDQSCRIN